jgi:hypothetical protein
MAGREQKRLLEQLRDLSAEVEELQGLHEALAGRPGSRELWAEIQRLKAERRERVG